MILKSHTETHTPAQTWCSPDYLQLVHSLQGCTPLFLSLATVQNSILQTQFIALLFLSYFSCSASFSLTSEKNGKPFSAAIIWKLRIIAVIIVAAGCMPSYVEVNTSDNTKIVSTTINFQNFFIIALGVIVGIISQIFVYGHKLQEDNDLIA